MNLNLSRALRHLFSALEHAKHACKRTQQMLKKAIAKAVALAYGPKATTTTVVSSYW